MANVIRNKSEIRQAVEKLFADPPLNDGELRHRMKTLDAGKTRRCLIDMLEQEQVEESYEFLFRAMMMQIGLGDRSERLFRIVVDSGYSVLIRGIAVSLLTDLEPDDMERLSGELPPEELVAMSELSLLLLFRYHRHDPDFGKIIRQTLEETPPDETTRMYMFELMERSRLEMTASAVSSYREALMSRKISKLHKRMLEIVGAEGGDEAVRLLERYKKSARGAALKREASKALLRARSNAIGAPKTQAEDISGYAYLSPCDGQGAFALLGVLENRDRTYTVADLVIRLTGDIRDGFLLPCIQEKEIEELVGEIASGGGFELVRVPLSAVAGMVAMAEKRTVELGKTIPEDSRPAVELFHKVSADAVEPDNEIESRGRPALSDTRRLFRRPEYAQSWFFDRGDLEAAGVEAPGGRLTKKWKTEAAAQLGETSMKARLLAMIGHMSLWHAWHNDPDTAALCRALAEEMSEDFKSSSLVHVMLEHSMPVLDELDDEDEVHHGSIGDPVIRAEIKRRCFIDVDKPKGKDLARLDFTEAAHIALGDAFLRIPGDLRPRESQWIDAAFAVAGTYLQYMGSRRPDAAKRYTAQLHKALTDTLEPMGDRMDDVLSTVHQALGGFIDEVCDVCDIQCHEHPRKHMAEAFFSDEHPALVGSLKWLAEETDGEENGGLEGRCAACDAYGPVDDVSLCEECGAKFERDMLRLREWNYSALAFGLNDERREILRRHVIDEFGKPMELVSGAPREITNTPKRRKTGKKRRQ